MDETDWMRRAMELAARGPVVDPNPRVGCVLVADGVVVGEGWHQGAGTPHAEAAALASAGEQAQGATAYVTLEPCHHTGRTGPCSVALVEAGVAKVVFAAADPNPQAAGGAEFLRERGLDVVSGVLAEESAALNQAWEFAVTRGRPRVIWKYASTLDGFSAAADGTSQWITSPEARADVHRLRAECGAIVVGTGTVVADNPALTVRDADGQPAEVQPLRVVVGARDLPSTLNVFDAVASTIHVRERSPHQVLAALHARGIRQIWLEGGPTLAAAWWHAGVVDDVVAYLAPAFLGVGRPAMADLGITSMRDIARLTLTDVALIGPDVRLRAQPIPNEEN